MKKDIKVIVINSAKGGVGNTRTAINLAKALAARWHTASIIDLDVTTPNIKEVDEVTVYTSAAKRMPNKTTIKRFIKNSFNEIDTEYVIIDTPPIISEMHLAISSYLREAEFFFVITRDENSVKDTGVGMRFFALYGINISKIILNMSDVFDGLVGNLVERIQLLESICAELIKLPKGKESHSWSNYKDKG
jgi:Mrp family chromosome partitioning ATPase